MLVNGRSVGKTCPRSLNWITTKFPLTRMSLISGCSCRNVTSGKYLSSWQTHRCHETRRKTELCSDRANKSACRASESRSSSLYRGSTHRLEPLQESGRRSALRTPRRAVDRDRLRDRSPPRRAMSLEIQQVDTNRSTCLCVANRTRTDARHNRQLGLCPPARLPQLTQPTSIHEHTALLNAFHFLVASPF